MTNMVQVTVAGDVIEGEEIQSILEAAGIPSALEPEPEADAIKVLVDEGSLEAAHHAIEALTEPDEPVAD